jgi:hypothetical protein
MAVLGVQYPGTVNIDEVDHGSGISVLVPFVEADITARPSFWELARVTDNAGAYNVTIIAYWPSKAQYTEWTEASGFEKWWHGLNPEVEPVGWFREVFFPSLDRFETLFSNQHAPEGAAHMQETMSGPIQEHGYFGSMRDRLPLSQTEALKGEKWSSSPVSNAGDITEQRRRIRVPGRQNLAIIRSGQDWLDTKPDERTLYLETLHPVLIKGMEFLRDNGDEVGCYSCRLMDVIDPVSHKADKDRTFGLAYFDDLSSLERWSKQHKTHLAIFGRFLQYAKELENNISLRLFHEVVVLTPEQQLFEYVGCHEKTGMLASL